MYIREDVLIAPNKDAEMEWFDLAKVSKKDLNTIKETYFNKVISKAIHVSFTVNPLDPEFNLPTRRRVFKFANINEYDTAVADFNKFLRTNMNLDPSVIYEQNGFTYHILHEDIVSDK